MPDGIMINPVLKGSLTGANDQYPIYTPGTEYHDPSTGQLYVYVKVTLGGTYTNNTLIAGRPTYWDVKTAVYTTKTDQGGTNKEFAGVLQNTVTTTYYTWIIAKGFANVLCTNSLTANSNLIPAHAAGTLAVASAATDRVVGTNHETGNDPSTPATTKCYVNAIGVA